MKKATKRLLGIFTFSILLSGMTLAQQTYSGNGNSGFGSPIGGSSMSINDDGTTITVTFTKGSGNFNDYMVMYIANGSAGRTTIDGNVNDNNDRHRGAISNVGSSDLSFPDGFQVTHAIAINTSFGGLWSISSSGSIGNNGLTFVDAVGNPSSNTAASFSFSFNWSEIGLTSSDDFSFVVVYGNPTDNSNTQMFSSNEGYGKGLASSNPGTGAMSFVSFMQYDTGDEIVPKTISGDAGWRLLSLPKTGGLVTDVSDDTPVQGITGGDDASSTTNFIIYDNDAEFEKPTNVTTAWGDGLGFGLYFYNNTTNGSSTLPVTLDASGAEPSSDVTVTLNPAASGYTLVGNPYASNYNTNSMTATSSNISNTIAFWNDGTSSYSTQDRTASSGYIISPWQGFWVQTVSAAATTLTMPTSGKTSSSTTGTFFSKEVNNRGDINFSLSSETTYDEAIRLAFRSEASIGYDTDDFGKLTPLVPSYATMAFESNDILKSVESLPYNLEEEVTLSLQPQMVGVSGDFTFAWNGLETIPGEWELILHDYETGANIDMRSETEYTFFQAAHAKVSSNPLSLLNGPAAVAMKAKAEGNRFGITIRPTSVSNETEESPALFALEQNYPNPFNPSTTISYSVQEAGAVNISVYNLMGQKVATLVDETKATGQYNVRWNAAGAASGMYYYRLEAGGQSITRKMTLIK